MSTSTPHDAVAALNQALSEVIDEIQELKQARWRIAETHPLHAVLDDIFNDLRSWARLIVEQDDLLGARPLAFMPSPASRVVSNPWPAAAGEEDVRRIVGEHLNRLSEHVATALAEQDDDSSRAVLGEVERGLIADRRALSEP